MVEAEMSSAACAAVTCMALAVRGNTPWGAQS